MNREVIQDFLNLPGVIGVALTNRRMRPYFHGFNAILNGQQQQAMAQGIHQVIENIPEGLISFEFYFIGNIAFIYKLPHDLVLLVLGDKNLDIKEYEASIDRVKQEIEIDVYSAVATFKQLLGTITQTSLRHAENIGSNTHLSESKLQESEPKPATVSPRLEIITAEPSIETPLANPSASPSNIAEVLPTPVITTPEYQPTENKPSEYKLSEFLTALNKLSRFTTQYLGKVVVGNYWKSTRPDSAWLQQITIDRNATISCPDQELIICSLEQQQQLQEWAKTYTKRCKQVIRNFDNMVMHDCLDAHQQMLLNITN